MDGIPEDIASAPKESRNDSRNGRRAGVEFAKKNAYDDVEMFIALSDLDPQDADYPKRLKGKSDAYRGAFIKALRESRDKVDSPVPDDL